MQSHQVGLNWNMKLKDSIPPTIIPMLAIWVLIFHFRLTTVQITMQGGYYYAAHVAGQVNAEHGDKATHIT